MSDMRTETEFPEALAAKVRAVSKTRGYMVRRVTEEEASTIRAMPSGWFDGWFNGCDGAQVVLETRPCGQNIIFRI